MEWETKQNSGPTQGFSIQQEWKNLYDTYRRLRTEDPSFPLFGQEMVTDKEDFSDVVETSLELFGSFFPHLTFVFCLTYNDYRDACVFIIHGSVVDTESVPVTIESEYVTISPKIPPGSFELNDDITAYFLLPPPGPQNPLTACTRRISCGLKCGSPCAPGCRMCPVCILK